MNLPIIYHPNYVAPMPLGHRFPMAKFQLLYEMLLADEITNKSHVCIAKANVSEIRSSCQFNEIFMIKI